MQILRQHPTPSGPGAPGTDTLPRSGVLGVLCTCSAPRAAALPGSTQIVTMKSCRRINCNTHVFICTFAHVPMLMCDCRKICDVPVCTDQFEIAFPAFQEALGLGIGWWLAHLPIHVFTCQAQSVFSTDGYFCDGLKCKCDLTRIQR